MSLTFIQLEEQLTAVALGKSGPYTDESTAIFKLQKPLIQKWLTKILQTSEKKLEKLKNIQENSLQWELVAHEALLIQAHLYLWKKGLKTITVQDWHNEGEEKNILLDPRLTASEEIQQRIRRSKKMHLSLPHLSREIDHIQKHISSLNLLLRGVEELKKPEELIPYLSELQKILGIKQNVKSQTKELAQREEIKRKPYHEFWSASGNAIWVGKKASDNDKLTFSLANGSDYWMHASGFPGSHVVIKTKKGLTPDQETIDDALQLAMAYSKAKHCSECEVIFTQCKYISRYSKGQPGKVQVSKHQTFYTRHSLERLNTIKKRTFPNKILGT